MLNKKRVDEITQCLAVAFWRQVSGVGVLGAMCCLEVVYLDTRNIRLIGAGVGNTCQQGKKRGKQYDISADILGN